MKDPGSFRDPSGHIFYEKNEIFRVVNYSYSENFKHLITSGLYEQLVKEKLLVKHLEVEIEKTESQSHILNVEKIFPITYPYEWSFSQLKEAALTTLQIQQIAVEYGMTLKDANPYNIQFKGFRPIFIDTLSFNKINNKDYTWVAYKQFCEMFLSPLCLMSFKDPSLNKLLIPFLDGIPLRLTNKLLPLRKKFNPVVFLNLILPNLISSKLETSNSKSSRIISKKQHLNIIEQLSTFIGKMKIIDENSEWGEYNFETLSEKKDYVKSKEETIESILKDFKYSIVWDIGSNDGYYSRKVSDLTNAHVMSVDIDWKCVEKNYIINKKKEIKNITPILLDLSNPSPGIGWVNKERSTIYSRIGKPDLICMFAVIHHLINRNIPLDFIIDFIENSSRHVLIEYVPFSDPKSKVIFASRGDDFIYPSQKEFENKLSNIFNIISKKKLAKTNRILYLLCKKGG